MFAAEKTKTNSVIHGTTCIKEKEIGIRWMLIAKAPEQPQLVNGNSKSSRVHIIIMNFVAGVK
jgi:hypothetical protein